jgi:starch synthase (maltosyl-transferring)
MKSLAKLGFTMSYTYFTWKNTEWELRDYLEELTQGPAVEYYRGNLFTNTPDILHEYLVAGGRPALRIRLLLAATLSPLYGIYSGYELIENTPLRPGSEEYLDSEKYQLRPRDWEAANNINADIARLNEVRRSHAALQRNDNLTFHTSENPAILFYRRAAAPTPRQWVGSHWQEIPPELRAAPSAGEDGELRAVSSAGEERDLLIATTLDPTMVQETMVHVPIAELGLAEHESYVVHDLMTDATYTWRGSRNYVRLDPAVQPFHLFEILR